MPVIGELDPMQAVVLLFGGILAVTLALMSWLLKRADEPAEAVGERLAYRSRGTASTDDDLTDFFRDGGG